MSTQTVDVEVIDRVAVMTATIEGTEYLVVIDLHRWPYRWTLDTGADTDTGRRMTLRGSAMAAMHSLLMIRARERGTSRRGRIAMRLTWIGLEIRGFVERWFERDRENFPHFVPKVDHQPTGSGHDRARRSGLPDPIDDVKRTQGSDGDMITP